MRKTATWLSALVVLTAALAWVLDRAFPLPQPVAPGVRVLAEDGTLLRAFPAADQTWRYPITPAQVAPVYREVLLAYEDRAFYYHPGINPLAIARAGWQNLKAGAVVSGGSTLSMQVAGLLDPYPRTLTGKARQALRTLQLEWHYSKDEILELYLNLAPFGGMLSGVEAASRHYFGKPAAQLSDAEAALLTVLPQRPSEWRPDRYPQRARRARDKVLRRMQALELWSEARVAAALHEPVAALPPEPPMLAPLLARRLQQQCPGCTDIHTLIDAGVQRQLQAVVERYRGRLGPRQSMAVMVVRNADLAVQGYVGAARFGDMTSHGHIDMTRAVRSPGSTLKPFAYAMALDQGLIHSHSLLLDTPRYGLRYRPHNFTGGFAGPVSATAALQRSLNLPVVQLVEHLGPQRWVSALLNAGLQLEGAGVQQPSSAVVLGGVGSTLESLVGTYTALAREGLAGSPRLQPHEPQQRRWLMSPGAAWISWRMLAHNPWRALSQVGETPWVLAWKTGTSYGYRDAWALGVSPQWTIGVWVGRPDGSPSPGDFGRQTAAPLLFRVHELLAQDQQELPQPASVTQAKICWPLGTAVQQTDNTAANCQQSHLAWLLNATAPRTLQQTTMLSQPPLLRSVWVDAETGRAVAPGCAQTGQMLEQSHIELWPQPAEPWLKPEWRRAQRLPQPADDCTRGRTGREVIMITGIEAGSHLQLPPGRTVLDVDLRVQGATGLLNWYLNGEPLAEQSGQRLSLQLRNSGDYRLSVVDRAGNTDSITFSFQRGSQPAAATN
ncbi:penicillin-binding protein 1C [Marinobacterium halophilum]|uniref:peptidoglycan glycosyltransferase n=1 Tax=Marinobacterium halophilum TaxID=267374 RepID=A0A2P8EVF4_9GAMM|nr:penicillin-binding protein 1C [Marinobacterium halophilum]PSL13428.1 penicillin-binding protein 1C [Marinobacterium halophilum]